MNEQDWNINFITRDDFKNHVKNTIKSYGGKLESYDLEKFNSNLIDPIKMVFDQAVYAEDWKTAISNEVFRQRDKSNNNEIGYFHQRIFKYIKDCRVPANGTEGGWDIIYEPEEKFELDHDNYIRRIYVELKNKHNTMNSSSSEKTYIKMQNQLLRDDDCACFLVEVIAKQSQNIVWKTSVDKRKISHNRIRRVSIDRFYEIITGQRDAFLKICMALPVMVQEVVSEEGENLNIPEDEVYNQLLEKASEIGLHTGQSGEDAAIVMSLYMLGFSTYNGFDKIINNAANS